VVHVLGAFMAFVCGSAAQWMHVALSFSTRPVYTSVNVCVLRVLISAFNVALFAIGILPGRHCGFLRDRLYAIQYNTIVICRVICKDHCAADMHVLKCIIKCTDKLNRNVLRIIYVGVLGRPFVKRFAVCYRTVVCLCLSVLSATLVYCGQTLNGSR